jgi:hypothetical protein
MIGVSRERVRVALLWLCLAVFSLRVLGQIEVLLLQPRFLPPFDAWESGLLPYPTLLPGQIFLIAWMSTIASEHARGLGWARSAGRRRALRIFSAIYAGAMAVRLVVTVALPPHTIVSRGLIPILAHWDLAAFIALVSKTPENRVVNAT